MRAPSANQSSKPALRRKPLRPAAPPPLIKSRSDSETSSVTPGSRAEGGGCSRYVGEAWLLALETGNLGSGKVAGKVLIVDHMW